MAEETPPKDKRSTLIASQQKVGEKEMREFLLQARDRIELKIIKAAKDENFIKAAAFRDGAYKDIAKEYVRLQGDLNEWTTRQSTSVARDWRKLAIADLPAGKNLTFARFSVKYLKDIIERVHPANVAKISGVNAALGSMLESDLRFMRNHFIAVRQEGALEGWSIEKMSREMLNRVTDERPAWQFIDSEGKRWSSRNYFRMLNRTVTLNVGRDTYNSMLLERGHDIVVIKGAVTDVSHEGCRKWAGTVVSLTGATKGLPLLQDAIDDGLFHPNCRHYTALVLDFELDQALADEKVIDSRRDQEVFSTFTGAAKSDTQRPDE